jgi:hypothetical protein
MLQYVARRVAGVQVSDKSASAMLELKHSRRVISMMMFGFVAHANGRRLAPFAAALPVA